MAPVKIGDTVSVHFTCKLEDDTIIDSSFEKEPLQFTLGKGQVLSGLEKAVLGMNPNESKTIKISSDDAHGPYRKDLVKIMNRALLPLDFQPEVGQEFKIKQDDGTTNTIRVTEVTPATVTFDTNNPLAGKDLIFNIQLLEIQ